MNFLYWLTFAVNLLGLVLALWLGLYLVSRSPKRVIVWLTALTLWSISGLFIDILLAINPPPQANNLPNWLHIMFWFWPTGTLEGAQNSWLQGWSFAPAFALWNHATTLMRPGKLTAWRRIRILAGYLLTLLAVVVDINSPVFFTVTSGNPLFVNGLQPGPWYPIVGMAMVILAGASAANLVRTLRATPSVLPHMQFKIMAWATLLAGLAGPVSIAGSVMGWPVPMVVMSLVEVIPVGLIGYGVARYSALVEGRTIQRDFLYNLALLITVVTAYLLASLMLVKVYLAPAIILVFVPVLAVITHTLMTTAHRLMDWLFYHREARLLRANLQRLVRLAGEGVALEENLVHALDTLCISVRASYGLILAFEGQAVIQVAAYHWRGGPAEVKKKNLDL